MQKTIRLIRVIRVQKSRVKSVISEIRVQNNIRLIRAIRVQKSSVKNPCSLIY